MQLQAKECRGWLGATRIQEEARKIFPLEPLVGARLSQHRDFGILTSRTLKQYTYVVLVPQFVVICLGSPRKTNTYGYLFLEFICFIALTATCNNVLYYFPCLCWPVSHTGISVPCCILHIIPVSLMFAHSKCSGKKCVGSMNEQTDE